MRYKIAILQDEDITQIMFGEIASVNNFTAGMWQQRITFGIYEDEITAATQADLLFHNEYCNARRQTNLIKVNDGTSSTRIQTRYKEET